MHLKAPKRMATSVAMIFTAVVGFCPTRQGSIGRLAHKGIASSQINETDNIFSRRQLMDYTLSTMGLLTTATWSPPASASVGSLFEYADTNAILQGMNIQVSDSSQQQSMVKFLTDGFDMKVLRQRIQGSVEEVWLGYGPEQLSIPKDFTYAKSFREYGGHSSIHLVYDNRSSDLYYRMGDTSPPGNSIAYVQLGVPGYRISQMVKNGGTILDAYGIVNVISPAGVPFRGIVGIHPDPIMFVAINCQDVEASKTFYQQLGFRPETYPYARPNQGQGQFEPPQPPKSVYLAPSRNGLGILLLPLKGKKITPNPVVNGLGIVYQPSVDIDPKATIPSVTDPSGVPITFQSTDKFQKEESVTR